MTTQIINSCEEAMIFAEDRCFSAVKWRAGVFFHECGQVQFEVAANWCAYYVKAQHRHVSKAKRLIWVCRW